MEERQKTLEISYKQLINNGFILRKYCYKGVRMEIDVFVTPHKRSALRGLIFLDAATSAA